MDGTRILPPETAYTAAALAKVKVKYAWLLSRFTPAALASAVDEAASQPELRASVEAVWELAHAFDG